MKKSRRCSSILAAAALLLLASLEARAAKPNILLIMCDDMGFSDLGCYGGEIETPNLDRLAREGMRFTQFYNNAKCTTTRASITTGLYPRFGKGGHLRMNMVTLGEAMGQSGYVTALCGKWHLGHTPATHPFHRGFQTFYGLLDGGCNYFDPSIPDPDYKGGRVRVFGENDRRITEFPTDFYTTDAFTDAALVAMRAALDTKVPFFIHVTYTAPHYPLHAPVEDVAKYLGRYRQGWDHLRLERWRRQQAMGLATKNWTLSMGESRAYAWDDADPEFEDLRMAVYAAMVDRMDQNIGRLLETLREYGADKNTLVLFLSDNGGCAEEPGGRDPAQRTPGPKEDYVAVGPSWGWAQNTPFRRYKSWLHEGGIATPLIAWWPEQIPAGTINRDVAHVIDILPTCLDVAGEAYPRRYNQRAILPCEGISMLPLLKGDTRIGHDQLAWFWSGNRAIRQGDWKLVYDKIPRQWELFDLSQDRCETHNLAHSDPSRVAAMRGDWFVWAAKVGLDVQRNR
jgi:arylsulfatase